MRSGLLHGRISINPDGSGAGETVAVALGTIVGVVVGSVREGVGVGEGKLILVAWLSATTGVWFGERR